MFITTLILYTGSPMQKSSRKLHVNILAVYALIFDKICDLGFIFNYNLFLAKCKKLERLLVYLWRVSEIFIGIFEPYFQIKVDIPIQEMASKKGKAKRKTRTKKNLKRLSTDVFYIFSSMYFPYSWGKQKSDSPFS